MKLTAEEAIEYKRCRASALYTIKRYGYLKDIKRGKIKWEPYEWQEQLIEWLQEGRNVILLKSRQVGASWTVAGYVAWLVLFHPDIEILLLSRKEKFAIKLLAKCKFVLNNFPDFIRREYNSNTQTRFSVIHRREGMTVVSESSVDSLTTTGESGRGDTAAFVFTDELAHLPNADDTWTAIRPATSRGGQIAIASSPSGPEGVFARIWMDAETGESSTFTPIRVHYTDCGFDEQWLAEASDGMTEEDILQEYELAFIGTGSPAFDPNHLEQCYIPMSQIMSDPELEDIRKLVVNSREFYTGVDSAEIRVSRGRKSRDFNAITSLNKYGIQIAAEMNKMPLDEWAGHTIDVEVGGVPKKVEIKGYVSKWHEKFPGMMYIEENGPGLTVENRHQLPDNPLCDAVVRRTTQKRKPRLVNQFKLAIAGQQVLITSKQTLYQLQLFQDLGNSKYGAPQGYKDDLVIAILEAYDALLRAGGFDFKMPTVDKSQMYHEVFSDEGGMKPLGVPAPPLPGTIPGISFEFPVNPAIEPVEWNEWLPSDARINDLMETLV